MRGRSLMKLSMIMPCYNQKERLAQLIFQVRESPVAEKEIILSNMASNLNPTDLETCFGAFRTGIIKGIPIKGKRFVVEPELTIKVVKR
jgi:hypothetical protein